MKTFKSLKFRPHTFTNGTLARMFFKNGYGVSVITGDQAHCGKETYELAVLKGTKKDWAISYETSITDDVLGWLTEEDVTKAMKQIQEL